MKINKGTNGFDVVGYACSFKFCTHDEKLQIANICKIALNRFKPKEKAKDQVDMVHEMADRINGDIDNNKGCKYYGEKKRHSRGRNNR